MKKHRNSHGRNSRPLTLRTLADIQDRVAILYSGAFESKQFTSALGWQKQTDELMADLDRRIEWTLGQLFERPLSGIEEHDELMVDLLMQAISQFAQLQEMLSETDSLDGWKKFFLRANVTFMLMNELLPECVQDLKAARSRAPTNMATAKKEYIFELTEDGSLIGKCWMEVTTEPCGALKETSATPTTQEVAG